MVFSASRLTTLLGLGLFAGMASVAHADTATVAVAANFTGTMEKLEKSFETSSGHELKVSYGSTGKLYAQISNGAPFDIFLAADQARPHKAVEAGLAVADSEFTYAQGVLALWSTEPLSSDDLATVLSGDYQHLAIGNPVTAPYGLAATQTLQSLKLWDSLKDKLVQGDNISQTYQFVATGNAELGFVALSQVKDGEQAGASLTVPGQYYQPIRQDAVMLKQGADNAAAQAFYAYLKSPEARQVIEASGYR
ncbi:molybdate ABC transporter substrate-binding protein [Pokkaliibacter sp. CJK22405]|uniref:molybdate ABC transporter substrate-binding protein n=1 Tax=Pokkaliibacter sp. CJK22405 TaxID=3384615 RepID=UPI00398512E4